MRNWDGMLVGNSEGRLFRIFNPPLHRLDRWIGWYARVFADFVRGKLGFRRRRELRGYVEIHGQRVRVVADATVLPNVPRFR